MNTAFSIVEAFGPRVRLHTPRGTPSRMLKVRLVNSIRRDVQNLCTDSAPRPARAAIRNMLQPNSSVPIRTTHSQDAPDTKQNPPVSEDELDLLRDIISKNRATKPGITGDLYIDIKEAPPSAADAAHQSTGATNLPLPSSSDLLRAFQNTRKTFDYLRMATSPVRPPQGGAAEPQGAIADLPQNTFSELLRSLDPLSCVSKEMDPTAGTHVGPGLVQYTDLGRTIDEFGVRRIYFWLLRRLVAAAQLRIEAGHGLLVSDYKVLLRCAGAASDLHMAKKIWHLMESKGQISLRDGDSYNEFIRARFLTEPLYTQFDMARFRVSPANMHKQKIWLSSCQLNKVRRLRYNILARQGHRFGQNRYTPEKAEGLVRILRKTKPIRKVFFKAINGGIAVDEKLLCSAMVAFGRNGALQLIKELILWKYWKIRVHTEKETGEVTVSGGTTVYRLDSPMYPTTRLLDAVVESFCCNAEIHTAFKVLDFISRRYNIQVPDATWSKLLEWTYVQSSRPASTEWKLAGWPEKIVQPDAVQMVWDTMVSDPYNVRPSFNDHIILIKSLLSRRRLKDAMHRMLELQPTYTQTLLDLENAFYEHVLTSRLCVDPAQSLQHWLKYRTEKQTMWYAIQTCCWTLFKRVRSNRLDDIMTVRLLPQLVDAFRPFFSGALRYRIATGIVEINNPNPVAPVSSSTRAVKLPALVTQDLVGTPVRKSGIGGMDGHADPVTAVSQPVPPVPATSKLWRRERLRVRNSVPSKILPTMLRNKLPSSQQLLLEFA